MESLEFLLEAVFRIVLLFRHQAEINGSYCFSQL